MSNPSDQEDGIVAIEDLKLAREISATPQAIEGRIWFRLSSES